MSQNTSGEAGTTTKLFAIRVILRILRYLSWSGLASFAIFEIVNLESMARRGGANLPSIEFALAELFAVFCCAVATDRGFSLGEKSFHERD